MRDAVQDAYRVAPDRRFISAIKALPAVIGLDSVQDADVVKVREGWVVLAGGERVVLLPDEAEFDVLWHAVVQRAQALAAGARGRAGSRRAATSGRCAQFLAPGAWASLVDAQRAWLADRADLQALSTAARCLVALSVQQLDVIGIGDALPARALASLAAYHALTGDDVSGDLALMADAMGYHGSARSLAVRLDANDPVRRFLLGTQRAGEIRGPGGALPEYLEQLRLARTAKNIFDARQAGSSTEPEPTLPLLRARFAADDDRSRVVASRDLPYATLRAVWEHGGASAEGTGARAAIDESRPQGSLLWGIARTLPRMLRVGEEELLNVFERLLARAARNQGGPFADAEVITAWYRGFFYSALFTMGKHHLDQLSPARPVDAFAARLGAADSPVGRDFGKWYAAMAASRTGKSWPEELVGPMVQATSLGMRPMILIFMEYRARAIHIADNTPVMAARNLFRHLDYRPTSRVALAHVAYSTLLDGALARRLVSSAMREGLVPQALADGSDLVRTLATSGTAPVGDVATALEWIEQREPRPVEILVDGYRSLISRQPHILGYRLRFAAVLEAVSRYEEARSVLHSWLEANPAELPAVRAEVEIRIAETFHAQGRHREAIEALEPALRWQTDRGLRLSAIANESIGNRRGADAATSALRARHPSSLLAPVTAAELAWRRGRHGDAAETLWQARRIILTLPGTAMLAERFLAAFDGSREREALAAFAILRQRFNPFVLRELVVQAHRSGRYQLAFDMGATLLAPGVGGMELALSAYYSLLRIKGERAAVDWLGARVDPDIANRIAQLVHRREARELIWSGIVDPRGRHADYLWLMRAADVKLAPDAARREAVLKHFESPRPGFYGTLARHLLGLASEDEVFRVTDSAHRRSTVAYFLGLKAESEGRRADAAQWYRVVPEIGIITTEMDPQRDGSMSWWERMVETGVFFIPVEFRWATARLADLRDRSPASFRSMQPHSGVELADGQVGSPQPLAHFARHVAE